MVRETVKSDCTRFLVHARRVREFSYILFTRQDNPPWNPTIFGANTVLRHLHQQCPEANIFPNLGTLTYRNTVENVQMFMCPSLQNLRLISSTVDFGVLELLEAHSPMIIALDLNVSFNCGFRIRSSALSHLSTLPVLQQLGVPLRFLDDPTLLASASSTFFPSITNLVVRSTQPILLCSLLNAISSSCLGTVWWETSDTDPNNILNVLTILARHPESWALIMGGAALPDELVTMHTLTPLLTHTSLTSLNLSAIWWLDLENEDVEHLALNLPLLTSLHLGTTHGLVVPPRITLRGLLPLFHHCPLENLGVVVDAGDSVPDSEFRLPPELPTEFVRNARRFRILDVGNGRIGPTKVAATALFPSQLVPRLTSLMAWDGLSDGPFPDPLPAPGSRLLWNQVADMYGELTIHEQSATNMFSWQGFNKPAADRRMFN
ncbi:hypothetical protein FB451DRAFT_1374319 [Mycena latifolia]|nr:hypothetical protein FB451DRAFT_1374319 [Mycena latifolia]